MKNYPECLHCGLAIHSDHFPYGLGGYDYVSWVCRGCGKQTTVGFVESFGKVAVQKTLKI